MSRTKCVENVCRCSLIYTEHLNRDFSVMLIQMPIFILCFKIVVSNTYAILLLRWYFVRGQHCVGRCRYQNSMGQCSQQPQQQLRQINTRIDHKSSSKFNRSHATVEANNENDCETINPRSSSQRLHQNQHEPAVEERLGLAIEITVTNRTSSSQIHKF